MKSVAVYLGSSAGNRPVFCEKAYEFGKCMAENGITVVYGGANVGTMKAVGDGAFEAGGKVIGVFPQGFKGKSERHFKSQDDLLSKSCTEMIFVKDMAERKRTMSDLSDCCAVLPGGWGTIDELSEHLVDREIGKNEKPIYILNIEGYYDALKTLADHMVAEGFLSPQARQNMTFCDTVEELVKKITR